MSRATKPKRQQVKSPDSPGLRAGVYGRQSKDKRKSVTDQINEGHQRVEDKLWILMGTYDDGSSASRFRKKDRENWAQLCADVDQGKLDVVVIWAVNRGSRDAEDWFPFLSLCRARGVFIYVISHDRTYDPRRSRDWRTLAEDGVDAAYDTEKLSEAVKRGNAHNAAAGKPHGPVQYGYERIYDPQTRQLVEQRIYEPQAKIVRRIIGDIAKRKPITHILRELNDEGIPAPRARTWYRSTVRNIADCRAYVGVRVHHGDEYQAVWPAIVTEKVWSDAQNVLNEPNRKKTKPGKPKWLLSYITFCGVCGSFMQAGPRHDQRLTAYFCHDKGCVTATVKFTDGLIARMVIEWLSAPEARDLFYVDDEVSAKLRDNVATWKRTLAETAKAVVDGELSPKMAASIEAGLLPKIKDGEDTLARTAQQHGAALVIDQAAFAEGRGREAWEALSLAAQRDVIKMIMARRGERIVINQTAMRMTRWSTEEQRWAKVAEQVSFEPIPPEPEASAA